MSRWLVVSSTFPQYAGDPRGRFVCRHWEQAAERHGVDVRVLAPQTRWVEGGLDTSLDVVRFRYAPRVWASLTGRFGMVANLREMPLRAALVPMYWQAQQMALRRQLELYRPDHVVAHMLLPCGWPVAVACSKRRVSYDLYGHGSDVDVLLSIGRWRRGTVLRLLAGAKQVYLPSQEKLHRVRAWLGADAASVHLAVETMAHVVATGRDPTVTGSGVVGPPRILFMGRLVRQKGVDVLLRAVGLLGGEVAIDIAGDGPERRPLERLAARLGVDARFLGYVEGVEHARAYARASVVCVPSREVGAFSEGAPLVVLEARRYGLPVVGTRVGGIPELCADDPQAELVTPNDPGGLAVALASVLRQRLGDDREDRARSSRGPSDGWAA
ncbi:MAG: glycosyltransferase family 4 protein [Myxococcales bacterium FL481]|nr:MAG: glycosyltransferase family 4 protein [Myxococcales bacterium FL481]